MGLGRSSWTLDEGENPEAERVAARGAVTAERRGLGSGLDDTSKGEQVPRTRACLLEGGSERRGTRSSQGGGGVLGGLPKRTLTRPRADSSLATEDMLRAGKLRGGGRDAEAPV